ncbi:hypothetical protein SK128_018250 [Halocaridina rubra]|uniref:EH domain-containing protein n=1 Tax=Halocaridina rubra TaxID=373956 RepID=A0AAN9A4J1_HALRR
MYNNSSGGGGPGTGWVPGMGMPPLGFGLVAQQPGGSRMMANPGLQAAPQVHQMPNWHQQQIMAAQMGVASSAVGVQPILQPHQQQHGFHPYQQHLQLNQQQQYQQQHHWVEAQKKAAEEQKKFYDQMLKQRQFDEQKMRLKAFSNTKKGGVSADSMIENILGTKDMPKPKSPSAPKKVGLIDAPSMYNSAAAKQGTAADWSKMQNVNNLFASSKDSELLRTSRATSHPAVDIGTATPNSYSENGVKNSGIAPAGNKESAVPGIKQINKPITLPSWLSNRDNVPAVYKHAGSLVEGKDGWVDTSRAYMLLMKTGLPPNFLGVLWEMVNRTQPGQLTDQEFITLLALIALVQSGQAITSADILSNTDEAVLPVIDHPALLPLVQDYIQHRQQIQQQQSQEHEVQQSQQQQLQISSTENSSWISESITDAHQHESKIDDDEFDDFVSCTSTAPFSVGELSGSSFSHSASVPVPMKFLPPEATKDTPKPQLLYMDKVKRMNLPELGCSPELSPTTSFDQTHDDDFDDFQSASVTTPSSNYVQSTHSNEFHPPLAGENESVGSNILSASNNNSSSNLEDKYAVFRELEASSENSNAGNTNSLPYDIGNSGDDGFGDFCRSEPVSLPNPNLSFPPIPSSNTTGSGTNSTTPVSFEVFSTPPEVPEASADAQFEADFGVFTSASSQPPNNYADIHEAMKRVEAEQKLHNASSWNDPFGEFEDASTAARSHVQPVPQLNIAGGLDNDDDFGDFMGPDGRLQEPDSLSFTHAFPRLSEGLGETQSVASLELPGLEMTVGLQASDGRGSGSGHSPDLFMQTRSEIGGVEEQFQGLTIDSPLTLPDGGVISPDMSSSGRATNATGTAPVLESFNGGFVDKYSIMRDEASKATFYILEWYDSLSGSSSSDSSEEMGGAHVAVWAGGLSPN